MEILNSPDLWLKTVQALGPDFFKDEEGGAISQIKKSLKEWLTGLFKSGETTETKGNPELDRDRLISSALLKKFKVTP